MSDAHQQLGAESIPRDELVAAAWRGGNLRWLMHETQQAIYDRYRAWEKVRANDERSPIPGSFPRIFCMPMSKRLGKTTLITWIKAEDCIRQPGSYHRLSSAFQKNIAEIVHDVSRECFATAPDDVKPVYKGSQGPQGAGFYFPNGSVLRLVGLDLHPDGARGQASDGDAISEAAFVGPLLYVVKNVIYHQYQGKPNASLILESSAPPMIDTEWERIFLPDALARGAYYTATIEDNPRLSRREKDEFIAAAGGRGHPDCEREYFNTIAVDPGSRVVPEFDESRHVQDWPQPDYAHCYVSADPGSRDLFGVLWGHWNFGRAALYIERDWAVPNALTGDVAAAVIAGESELWGKPDTAGAPRDRFALREARKPGAGPDVEVIDRWHPALGAPAGTLTYFDGKMLRSNPFQRVSDIDIRLCSELDRLYGLYFSPISKPSAEAMANTFRDALHNGKIVIHPRCVKLIAHLKAARWNKKRTAWERTSVHGHYDLLACAIYLWWLVKDNCHLNPNAPYRPVVDSNIEVMDNLPWQRKPEHAQMDLVRSLVGHEPGKRPGRIAIPRR